MNEHKELVKPIADNLSLLKQRAETITVSNQEEYVQACQIVLDGRAYIKDVGFKLDPGIESARAHLEFLRNEKAKYTNPASVIVETAARKAETWKAEERRKAEQEQNRINEQKRKEAEAKAAAERKQAFEKVEAERRERAQQIEAAKRAGEIGKREAEKLHKEAEQEAERSREVAEAEAEHTAANVQTVEVAPAVPKVSGIKARVNWKFKVVNRFNVNKAFLQPDEVTIGAYVRATKNKQKSEQTVGGIVVWSEDGV